MPLPRLAFILSLATLVAAAHAETKPVTPPPEQPARKVLAPDAGAEAAKNHPELKEQLEKIKAMTPEERRTFFKEHPELREKLMERIQSASPAADKRADFLKEHPELKEQLEKLKAMTPKTPSPKSRRPPSPLTPCSSAPCKSTAACSRSGKSSFPSRLPGEAGRRKENSPTHRPPPKFLACRAARRVPPNRSPHGLH